MRMGLLGRKVGMTHLFDKEDKMVAVTALEVGPCVVTQVKHSRNDGYSALQIGFGERKEKHLTKPLLGHLKKNALTALRFLREIRMDSDDAVAEYQPGQELKVDLFFKEGDLIDVIGITKGKGFQGVMKRHGFRGGPSTHGSMQHRAPGSIGSTDFQRVIKGKKMAGQMGNVRMTVQNLRVVRVFPDKNLLLVIGAVPGSANGLVFVRKAIKEHAEA